MEASSSSQPGGYYTLDQMAPIRSLKPEYMGVFAATLNVINTVLGAGLFGVPNSFVFCGVIPSVTLLALSMMLTFYTSVIIIKLSTMLHSKSTVELTEMTLGKTGSNVMRFALLFITYASMTAYLIMGTEVLQGFLQLAGLDTTSFKYRLIVVIVYGLVLPIALTIPKKLGFINYASFFCFLSLITYAVGIVYKSIVLLPKQGINPTAEQGKLNINIFNSLGIYAIGFAISGLIIPIIKNMENNTIVKYKAVGSAYFISFVITLVPGVLGYLIFGIETKPFILSNFDLNDVLFSIIKAACFIVVTTSYPVIGLTPLGEWSKIIYNVPNADDLTWKQRSICLLLVNSIPLLVTVFIPNVRPILSIGGALGAGVSCFVLPPLMWLLNNQSKWYHFNNLVCILFFVIGTAASGIATYESIIDAINSFQK